MKTNMNSVALSPAYHESDSQSLVEILDMILEHIKNANVSITSFFGDCKCCAEMYNVRKSVNKSVLKQVRDFANLSETKQVATELRFFRSLRELNDFMPKAEEELKNSSNTVIAKIMLSEIHKISKIISTAQSNMSKSLYPNEFKTLSSQEEIDELADFWTELEA